MITTKPSCHHLLYQCFILISLAVYTISAFASIPYYNNAFSSSLLSLSSSSSASLSSSSGTLLSSSLSNEEPEQQSQQIRTVLVTGGAGYIGSHTCLELLLQSSSLYRVIVVDNFDNSNVESLKRVQQLYKEMKNEQHPDDDDDDTTSLSQRLIWRKCDIRNKEELSALLNEFPDITSCIHFAGLKAVGDSVKHPLSYYDCNIGGTVTLLQLLQQYNVRHFVFSSSATVYGDPEQLPITETAKLSATNPYGRTKLFIEEILRDCHASNPSYWNILILRYFNPIGAHPSGMIGEDPRGIPNNLMPFIAQVCVGRRPHLSIFGNDYNTPDGTGVRDYIHVVDLAKGHVAALEQLYTNEHIGCKAINLGTGQGISVMELLRGMEKATGKSIPYVMTDRRPGDVATVYADPTMAQQLLHWKASLTVDDMCRDTWKWQSNNPYGYETIIQEEKETTKELLLETKN